MCGYALELATGFNTYYNHKGADGKSDTSVMHAEPGLREARLELVVRVADAIREALGVLGHHVISVHAKDGVWPPKDVVGALGHEKALGSGDVGIPAFVAKLKEIGYQGSVNVEREGTNPEVWRHDVAAGVRLLNELT